MRKLLSICLIIVATVTAASAQPLFTYGKHSVSKEDFLKVYKKNSLNKDVDMSDTALASYLKLYSLFRMKVTEAEKEKLDTLPNIIKELDNYRRQLAKNYLTDEDLTKKIIHEAYDRMHWDRKVAHILVSCTPGSDTTAAYKKIDSLYQLLVNNKADFETLAQNCSDDKYTKDNGGDLGYITGLQTVYAFENAAFSTPVGKFSKPIRTQFGYHIVKVKEQRADKGQIKVAQIMIAVPKSKGQEAVEAGRKRADSALALLKNGTPFEDLVKTYSDDQYSNKEGGVMKPFGVGKMTPKFEDAAFDLKKPGDISQPILTDYGWHIIKLISKTPLQPLDSIYSQLKHKVENDSRSSVAREHYFNKVKEKNGYKQYGDAVKEIADKLVAIPDTGKNAKMVRSADYANMRKPLFSMGDKTYLQIDFVKFFEGFTHGKINGPHIPAVHDAFSIYVTNTVNEFQEHKLAKENPEFRSLMEEYKDGIMLFELMDRHVWGKASHDSEGLKKYFEQHKDKYIWEPGFEGSIYKCKNKVSFDSCMKLLLDKSNTEETIVKRVNVPSNSEGVTVQRGRFEFSHFKEATKADLERISPYVIYPTGVNTTYSVVQVKEMHNTPGAKTLDEARGYVVAEYQDYLEKSWNERLRSEYTLNINDKVLKSLSKNSKVSSKTSAKKKK